MRRSRITLHHCSIIALLVFAIITIACGSEDANKQNVSDEQVDLWLVQGVDHLQQDKVEQAFQQFSLAVEARPNNPYALNNLAYAIYKQARGSSAVQTTPDNSSDLNNPPIGLTLYTQAQPPDETLDPIVSSRVLDLLQKALDNASDQDRVGTTSYCLVLGWGMFCTALPPEENAESLPLRDHIERNLRDFKAIVPTQ